jgi:hypothetical protein
VPRRAARPREECVLSARCAGVAPRGRGVRGHSVAFWHSEAYPAPNARGRQRLREPSAETTLASVAGAVGPSVRIA